MIQYIGRYMSTPDTLSELPPMLKKEAEGFVASHSNPEHEISVVKSDPPLASRDSDLMTTYYLLKCICGAETELSITA